MVSFLTFGGWRFIRLGLVLLGFKVLDSYVSRLNFLRLGVSHSYVWGLVSLRSGVSCFRLVERDSYVWRLVVSRLLIRDSFLCWLGILTFGG